MAKPIALLKINTTVLPKIDGDLITEILEGKLHDYYILVLPSTCIKDIFELQVFYDKDFTEVQHEELKALVKDAMDKAKEENDIPYVPAEDRQTAL